jgi:hypothetical protein
VTFKYPKSVDACNRLANCAAVISTGIDVYVFPLITRSYSPLAASDAVAKRVTVAD